MKRLWLLIVLGLLPLAVSAVASARDLAHELDVSREDPLHSLVAAEQALADGNEEQVESILLAVEQEIELRAQKFRHIGNNQVQYKMLRRALQHQEAMRDQICIDKGISCDLMMVIDKALTLRDFEQD